ncbi:hypothetical protein COOONC_19313 [Cooperia oncophora]
MPSFYTNRLILLPIKSRTVIDGSLQFRTLSQRSGSKGLILTNRNGFFRSSAKQIPTKMGHSLSTRSGLCSKN